MRLILRLWSAKIRRPRIWAPWQGWRRHYRGGIWGLGSLVYIYGFYKSDLPNAFIMLSLKIWHPCDTAASNRCASLWSSKYYRIHRYRGEIPKLAAIFSRHGEQFGGIRFYSESACVNCIFLRYERVLNRARKAATSATHIKVIARVICIAHSPHLFSAKSRIPPNCSPCREKNLRGRYWNFGISVSISVTVSHLHRHLEQLLIKP